MSEKESELGLFTAKCGLCVLFAAAMGMAVIAGLIVFGVGGL